MRSLMLILGACLVAVGLSGCSSTGGCNSGFGLLRGNIAGNSSGCSGGCGNTACSALVAVATQLALVVVATQLALVVVATQLALVAVDKTASPIRITAARVDLGWA